MVPDKIHLFFSSDGDYLAFKEKPFEGTVAYIRKDALQDAGFYKGCTFEVQINY